MKRIIALCLAGAACIGTATDPQERFPAFLTKAERILGSLRFPAAKGA